MLTDKKIAWVVDNSHEVRSEAVYDGAEGHAVSPGRREVGHVHVSVAIGHPAAPLLQPLDLGHRHGH